MTVERWQPGDHVVVRSMWGKKFQAVLPMTVVVDSDEVLVLYLAGGTPFKTRSTYHVNHLPVGDWVTVDDVWREDLLRIRFTGDEFTYFAMWRGDQFRNWYVNLESSHDRTPIGIDFVDSILDVRVQPDLAGWEWKDEDELAEAVSLGLVSQAQADSYYAAGRRAIERLESRDSPLGDGWEDWRPDPSWPVPQLPLNWRLDVG